VGETKAQNAGQPGRKGFLWQRKAKARIPRYKCESLLGFCRQTRDILGQKKRTEIKSVRTTDTTDHSGVIVTSDSKHTTETTDISHTTRNAHARAHTRSAEIPQKSVVNVVDLLESESSVVNVVDEPEARRIVADLVTLHRDGAISGPDDPELASSQISFIPLAQPTPHL
jgi:hypothetical protein